MKRKDAQLKKWRCVVNHAGFTEVFVFAEDPDRARAVVSVELIKKNQELLLDINWLSAMSEIPVEETAVVGPRY